MKSHLHHAGRLLKPINFTILYSEGLVKDVGEGVTRRWVGVCIQIRVRVRVGGKRQLWLLGIWTEDIRAPTHQAKIEGNPILG